MKKIISTISLFSMLALAGTASAAAVNGANGTITITDAGPGPGIAAIAISAKSFVTYSGVSGAGGYANTCGNGDVMAVVSASSAADPKIALYFAVRDSNNPACVPDNNVYQRHDAAEAAPTAALVAAEINTDFSTDGEYSKRGGGSAAAGGS